MEANLRAFSKTLEASEGKDAEKVKQEVPTLQQETLMYVGRVEECMVQGFPFKVPEQYANLPQLKVRALQSAGRIPHFLHTSAFLVSCPVSPCVNFGLYLG